MACGTRRTALMEINLVPTGPVSTSLHNSSMELPLTPVSPEEELIRQRGRRKTQQPCPVETLMLLTPQKSPNKSPRKNRTPQKVFTPNKYPVTPTRTSPRKRLILSDTPDSAAAPSTPKKARCCSIRKPPANVEAALTALSHDQLVDLLKGIMLSSPEIKQTIRDSLPVPDLSPLEDRLKNLQRNIYRSFPSSRWGSKRDAFCYRRVCTHLETFKKECVAQGKQLVDGQQWTSAFDYALMAWAYVSEMPDWDNPAHNKSKTLCYKALASICLTALKKDIFDKTELKEASNRLQNLTDHPEVMAPCVKHLQGLLQKYSFF